METNQQMHSAFESLCPAEWSWYQLHHEKFLWPKKRLKFRGLQYYFSALGIREKEMQTLFKYLWMLVQVGGVFLTWEKYVFAFKATCCPLCINKLISTKTFLSNAKNWPTVNCRWSSVFTSAKKISKSCQPQKRQRAKRLHGSSLHANEVQVPSLSKL